MSTKRMSEQDDKNKEAAEAPDTATTTADAPEAPAHDHDHDDHDDDHDHDHPLGEDEIKFVEDPSFELDYKGECLYEVKVSVPAANEKQQASEAFEELKDVAEVPGFRKGKIPRKLLENKFGKVVRKDVVDKLATAAFRKLVKDEELRPIALPDVDGLEDQVERAEDAPLTFTLKFEVAPRCELGKYRGIEVERPVVQVDEKDVEETILDIRKRQAMYETVEDTEAQDEDQVIISFKGMIDGEAFQGGEAENYPYILGSGRFFQEFEEVLRGAKAGEEKQADVPFPEDYSNPTLAGKTANFTITVHEIKRKQLPDLDDEFAQQAGYENVEDMKQKVKADLQTGSSEQSQRIAEDRAIEKIVAESTFEIPRSLIESTAGEYYEQELRRLLALRVPASELAQRDEEIRKEAEENALRNIKGFVVVNEIGEAEGVEVTEADFEREAEAITQRTGMGMDVVQRFLQQEDQRDSYANRIVRQKAMAVVMDNAVITDKEVPHEELQQEDEAGNDE